MVRYQPEHSYLRLAELARTDLGIETAVELAELFGVSRGAAHLWQSRGVSKGVAVAAQYRFGWNAVWIIYGRGPEKV